MLSRFFSIRWLILSVITMLLSWLTPGSIIGASLAFFSICALAEYFHGPTLGSFRQYYALWLVACSAAFYWTWSVAQFLSKQPWLTVSGLFLVFTALLAIQFCAVRILFCILPASLDRYGLRLTLAWVSIESLPIRIFPWSPGHVVFGFLPLVQLAEFGGVHIVSAVMLWCAENLALADRRKSPDYKSYSSSRITVYLVITGILIFGIFRIRSVESMPARDFSALLVQANPIPDEIDEGEFMDMKIFNDLTSEGLRQSNGEVELIVWPETVLPFRPNESIFHRRFESRLPSVQGDIPLLLGASTFRRPDKHFNSAVLIEGDGNVPLPYNKIELIPFGEYIPFREHLPFLSMINPLLDESARGDRRTIFPLPSASSESVTARIAPLICYEEITPQGALDAVRNGANLLVGLSDDAWLGKYGGLGLHQHFVMAAFRAIETRRAFIRSTSTGVTTALLPNGREVARLPIGVNGVLQVTVPINSKATIYSQWGDTPWWCLSAVSLLFGCIRGILILFHRTRTNFPR